MKKIFELVENTSEQVVIKVNAKDPLTVAKNPYVQGNYAYINVTKGDNHTLTIIKDDCTTDSFHWGLGGHTLIGGNYTRLKNETVKFLAENNIHLAYTKIN